MKRLLCFVLFTGLFALPASAAVDMLTAAGVTSAPSASTCPATGSGTCSAGWFSIRGAATVVVHVWEDTGTATVVLKQRLDSADGTWTLKTWTNPASTEVAVVIDPAAGDIQITVSAIGGGGTVKAKLEASSRTGARLW